jgi:hypothetical protein
LHLGFQTARQSYHLKRSRRPAKGGNRRNRHSPGNNQTKTAHLAVALPKFHREIVLARVMGVKRVTEATDKVLMLEAGRFKRLVGGNASSTPTAVSRKHKMASAKAVTSTM